MSPDEVILTPEAQADIRRLSAPVQARSLDRLEWISEHTDLLNHQMLHGQEWSGCFRYRIGDYRVIYQLDRTAHRLTVLKVGHRRDIYR